MKKDNLTDQQLKFIEENRKMISDRLKTLRKKKHSSAEKFAHENGLNRIQYARCESGKHNISMDYFLMLLSIHGIGMGEFMK